MCVCDFDLSTLFPNQLIDSPQRVSSGFFYFLVTYSYLSLSLSLFGWLVFFIYRAGVVLGTQMGFSSRFKLR